MKSETPRSDEAARQGCYLTTGDYASTCGKQIIHIDFARQLETELNEAKSQAAFLEQQVRTNDEALAGLEETQTLCEAQQEALNDLSTLASDVKHLVTWMLNHSPACDSDTLKTFLAKHPDLK